ncbi:MULTISPECIES: hypothetical protein [Streptomyces]|uniref:hypothetical protein n=1 Tax=Streptomyces TaxID=1883 RepID=UPI0033E8EDB2
MRKLDRFVIDDGLHLPEIAIDEDASRAAGTARFYATCSCGRMPRQRAGAREQALASHVAHVGTKVGPAKGPDWLPVGARVVVLVLVMAIVWGVCFAAGQIVAHEYGLTGAALKAVLGGANLTGLALAFGLMVAVRRYIAPTRA